MTPTARAVAAVLTAAGQRNVSLPEAVADRLAVTDRALRKALARLEDAGLVVWHRRAPGGDRVPFHHVEVLDPAGLATAADGAAVSVERLSADAARTLGAPDDLDGACPLLIVRTGEVR